MRIITMAIDCYHFLLCTNTKSRDCIIGVRFLHTPTEEKSSIHLCPLLICSECTIKRLFPTLIFKSYLSPEKPSATLPHPSTNHTKPWHSHFQKRRYTIEYQVLKNLTRRPYFSGALLPVIEGWIRKCLYILYFYPGISINSKFVWLSNWTFFSTIQYCKHVVSYWVHNTHNFVGMKKRKDSCENSKKKRMQWVLLCMYLRYWFVNNGQSK